MDTPSDGPTQHDRHIVRLAVIRERMQQLNQLMDSATTPVLAQQYSIEISTLECEQTFLRAALQSRMARLEPPCV